MTALKIVFEPDDDGWWSVEIPELKGVRSDGRTLEEARRKIREALASAEDLGWNDKRAATAEFIEDVRLPSGVEKLIAKRIDALLALEAAASDVEKATVDLVQRLTLEGRSLRDIAALLGLSHGRVHQIQQGQPSGQAPRDRRAAANRAFGVAEAAAQYRTRRRRAPR